MALINSKWRKTASDNAIDAVARVGGVGIAAYVLNAIQNPEGGEISNIRDTMIKVSAPGLALLGVAGDIFLSHPVIRAFCQGLYAYAVPRTLANFSKDLSEAMGWDPMPEFQTNDGKTPPKAALPENAPSENDGTTSGIPAIKNGTTTTQIMNGTNANFNANTTPYVVIPPQVVEDAAKEVKEKYASEDDELKDIKGLAEAMLINN